MGAGRTCNEKFHLFQIIKGKKSNCKSIPMQLHVFKQPLIINVMKPSD